MRAFDYASPERIEEVIALLEQGQTAGIRPLAGGTDLLPLLKADIVQTQQLVNIKSLGGLHGIQFNVREGLRMGALTTLSEIEFNPAVQEHFPSLGQALALAATAQLRNMATVAGNLLQRPRCWYYRNAHFDCWLKGGETCPMRDGENRFARILGDSPCWAVHPSDLAPVLISLNAEVSIRNPRGEYGLYVSDLLQPPSESRRSETLLAPDEVITEIRVPTPTAGTRMTYLKAMDRKIWAFALAGVAASLRLKGKTVEACSLVLSGVANVPVRAVAAEDMLIGAEIDSALIERAAGRALDGATPLRDNAYKIPLAKALVRRALETLSSG